MLHCASTTWSSPPCSDLQSDLAGEQSKTKLPEIIYSSNDFRIATCNISLVTFLALRDTPLAFAKACLHEHLKPLHQAAGYCRVIFSPPRHHFHNRIVPHRQPNLPPRRPKHHGHRRRPVHPPYPQQRPDLTKRLVQSLLYHPHLSIHPLPHRRWNAPLMHHLEGSHYYHLCCLHRGLQSHHLPCQNNMARPR
jgi:hypothetical protein